MIEQFGGLIKDKRITEVGNFEDTMSSSDIRQLYKTLKDFIEKYNIFRTYNLRECRKRRVYLEDEYRYLPKESMDDLLLEQQVTDIENFEL